VNHAAPSLAFIDRLGFQMQFAFVGVVLEECAEAFQGVDVDILAGRHLGLLRVRVFDHDRVSCDIAVQQT
jgi:hypothetical protein